MSPTPRRPSPDDLRPGGLRRRRSRGRHRRRSRRNALVVFALVLVSIPLVLFTGGVGAVVAFRDSCNLSSLRPVSIGANTFVYAADGTLLGSIPAERNRQPVPLSRINPFFVKAAIAIEDRRFYQHGGVDYEGILRAAWKDLNEGRIVEGGSTITQQLVRNLYITREQTIERKIKEACLAIKLNRNWSKNRILASWMNQVYFGNRAYGVEAAAQTYFGKAAKRLNLMQAALLAGLPQAPSLYDPINFPEAALARRTEVLRAMESNGDISAKVLATALADKSLHLKPGRLYSRIREPYFFSYVRDQLIDTYGVATVQSGGLRVYTTIQPRYQRVAERAIRESLYERGDPAAALVAINPRNGAIRAMTSVYSSNKRSEFNLVAQARRQAGSTFKTFVLTAAVEQGMNPASTVYMSAPLRYQPDPNVPAWNVATYSHTYAGPIDVRSATLRSDNSVYAQLTLDVGPENVARMAKRLGVRTPLLAVPSIGLGSIAISPLDMASAYATLAAGGIYSKPMAIRRVVLAGGKVDRSAGWGRAKRHRVLQDGVAYTVTKILEQNVLYGTGTAADIGRPAAGKTGTTENHADAWFVGYTPNLEAAVWVGYPEAEIPMESVHGRSVSGGSFPAEIWGRFMSEALRYSKPQDWREPRSYPDFRPWSKGRYSLEVVSTSTTTTGKTTGKKPTTRPVLVPTEPGRTTGAGRTGAATTGQEVTIVQPTTQVVTLPPATTITPPPVTTAPPPPVTTEAVPTTPAPP